MVLAGDVGDRWISQVNCESEGDQGRWETDRCLYNLIPEGSSIIPLFGAHYDYQKQVTMSRSQFGERIYVSLSLPIGRTKGSYFSDFLS